MPPFPRRKPALLPGSYIFGLVPHDAYVGREAGVNNWTTPTPAYSEVTAVLINDTSGGRFTIDMLTVYDEQVVDPSEFPPLIPSFSSWSRLHPVTGCSLLQHVEARQLG